jgi:hypothetical protein
MADKDTTVDLPDPDAEIVIELGDDVAAAPPDPTVVAEAATEGATPREAPKPKPVPRVRLKEPGEVTGASNEPKASEAAEEAAAALTASLRAAEDRNKALEATAASERARAEDANRRLAASQAEAQAAREQVQSRELAIVSTGIDTAQGQLDALQADLTRLYEAGEFAKVSEMQVKIGKTAAQLDRLQETKTFLETRAPQRPDTGRVEAAPVNQTSLFERYVSQFHPTAQSWLRAHPECAPAEVGGNAVSNARMMLAHNEAEAAGIKPGTPEYFQSIDAKMAGGAVTAASPLSAAAVPVAVPKAAVVPKVQPSAPPSREVPSTTISRNVRQITLTKDQQEAARMSFPHLDHKAAYTQYALNLIELTQEGKMGRTTH